jgi:Protein of unknown function (DUF3732)
VQIKTIFLFGKNGFRRDLSLKTGSVNIITGKSGTGKSSLIDIVDYCLGGRCEIAEGPIRDHVAWYGLLLEFPGSQVFVARRDPGNGDEDGSCFYLEGQTLEIPETIDKPNSTWNALQNQLHGKLGIAPNLHTPPDGQTRSPVVGTIRHALTLCYQQQDEIATKRKLFHRQDEYMRFLHFKDTLPYFLGIVEDNNVQLEQQLRDERREYRAKHRKFKDEMDLRGQGITKALRLISEAREEGLIPPEFNESLDDLEAAVAVLRRTLEWKPSDLTFTSRNNAAKLRDEFGELKELEERTATEIETAEMDISFLGEYADTATDHMSRLQSIGLYPEDYETDRCPVCNGALEHQIPSAAQLRGALIGLNDSLRSAQRDRPQLQNYIIERRKALDATRKRITEIREEYEGILQSQRAASQLRDENLRKSRVVGRISLWVESIDFTSDLDALQLELKERYDRIQALEAKLDPDAKQERLGALLGRISVKMSNWARAMNLEHTEEGSNIRLDLSKGTIVVDKGSKSIELAQIGSGQNWLGYHLIVHLALHQHLVENNRPVPRFLFLDQPTQVYFPKEETTRQQIKETGALATLKDDDREAVRRIFAFIFDEVERMGGQFQVVISDHANLRDDPRFQDAIREEWREDDALIPQSWKQVPPSEEKLLQDSAS